MTGVISNPEQNHPICITVNTRVLSPWFKIDLEAVNQ